MKTALITGASSGIGREFARVFAANGWNVVLVARSEDVLVQLASELHAKHGIDAVAAAFDLTDEASPLNLFTRLGLSGIRIDALVNNAGISTHGKFAEIPAAADMEELHLNILALTHLTKLFLPPMISRGHGYVLNVASTAAFQPGPLMAVYYASKAYVFSLSEALSVETRGTGVSVTALCPGLTETGFQVRGNIPITALHRIGAAEPASVARAGYRAMLARKTSAIPGAFNAVGAFLVRFASPAFVAGIIGRLNRPIAPPPQRTTRR
jgi:uncharacterized protein